MPIIDEVQSKKLERILAWSSVAYALGFITVMAHTAQIGIPIIQLFEPVYVLVGLPLAVVAFFSRRLWIMLKARTSELGHELDKIKTKLTDIRAKPEELKTKEDAALYLAETLGSVIGILMPDLTILKIGVGTVAALITDLVVKKSPNVAQMIYSGVRKIEIIATVYRGFVVFNRYLGFIVLMSLVPIGSYLYIMYAYPSIPQSLAGGKPVAAKLIVDINKIPWNASELHALFNRTPKGTGANSVVSNSVDILYITHDVFYVRRDLGPTIAFKRDAVNGVIWTGNDEKESNKLHNE